ncbi:MarR family transcriptional regulator [Nocardioides pacificus]
MSDRSIPSGTPPSRPATTYAAAWGPNATLLALRELVDKGGELRRVVSRRAKMNDREFSAVEHLTRESLGPAELARRLEVSSAASTGIVDRLVERGHVERQPHAGDRRRTEVHLTPSAREEVLGHLLPMFRALAEADAEFTDEERAVVERYLRGAIAAMDAVIEEQRGTPEP